MNSSIFRSLQTLQMITLLAWRYIHGTRTHYALRTMVWICGLGIFLGTCTLGITTSIMNGFERETRKKLQGIYPDIVIEAPSGATLEAAPLISYLQTTYCHEITGVTAGSTHHIVVQKKDGGGPSLVGLLKAIDPITENSVSPLHEKVITPKDTPTNDLATLLSDHNLILGSELASLLDVTVGDSITLYYNQTPQETLDNSNLTSTTCHVRALLTTGIGDYDATIVIGSNDLITNLLEHPCTTQVGVKCNPLLSEIEKNACIDRLKKLPDVVIHTWYDQYPAIIAALKLEKLTMYILLALFVLIASINNISLLFMFITHKQTDIALLVLHGVSTYTIMGMFLIFNGIIALAASVMGIGVAWAISTFLQVYPCIELPDAYYVTYLPIEIHIPTLITIGCGSVALSCLTALLPIISLRTLSISDILRAE